MIKYPFNIENNKKDNLKTSPISYKNRGLSLETMLNDSNKYYLFIDKAIIYKKPTQIHVVKTNKENKITEAFFEKPSTSDYNGLYKGKYIDFEAKETKSKTSFNLKNINSKQLKHLYKVDEMGGISFIIVYFTSLNDIFFYSTKNLKEYISKSKRNSIPIDEFIKKGRKIEISLYPILDYLVFIDELLWTSKQISFNSQLWQLGLIALQ